MKSFKPYKPSPQAMIRELENLFDEIQTHQSNPEYHTRMKELLHDMLLLTYLEFTNKGPKSLSISDMTHLTWLMKS